MSWIVVEDRECDVCGEEGNDLLGGLCPTCWRIQYDSDMEDARRDPTTTRPVRYQGRDYERSHYARRDK